MYPPLDDFRSAGSIECGHCGRVLAGRQGFITHHKRRHARQKPKWAYSDLQPDNPRNFPAQKRIELKGLKICKTCGHSTGSVSGMYKHFAAKHPAVRPRYKISAIVVIDGGRITIKKYPNKKGE
jgi:hypothetical protein